VVYQSLYRRYRPQRFADVRGQDHLVTALQNSVREGRVGHAYLFSGPRGTGKTSTARILAKVLNCESPADGEPCGVCASCVAIEHGTSFDVHELDAASNNKVDDIRELITKASLGTPGHTKVYILDEVHMLSAAASNALLKTLEEPPEHVKFVLATTDPQKVLPTIRSRCQHFEVHLLSADELQSLAEFVANDAGLDVTPEAIDYVVRAAAGSARDMLSALDQVAAAGGVLDDGDALDELVEALCDRDTGRALVVVEAATSSGRSPRLLGEQLIARLRDVFLAAVGADLSRLNDRDRARVAEQAARLTAAGSTRALELLGEAFVGIQDAPDPRVPLEVALVRLTRPEAELSMAALADRIGRLERGDRSGGAPAAARSAQPAEVPADQVRQPALEHTPAEQPPSGAKSGTRPADSAREALAQKKRGASRPQPNQRPPAGQTAPSSGAPKPTPSPADVVGQPGPDPELERPGAVATVTAGELPSRDELTLVWADAILPKLSNRARSRFSAGRFVSVDEVVVFGLPNLPHTKRCEEVRGEVESVLGAHFGRPVPLRVVVDGGANASASGVPGEGGPDATAAEVDIDEPIDLTDLADADDVATSGVERIAQVFPGAELVEED
jgi:DNA polymerase III subunit gamma/tau